ncbi:MAG: exopolysaccharide biosynthesis protein [Alphaproteobacteria bacterium]|nr:exopolysaccharide biosynthesis protein [Alphaproteobacteria bacterium]
MDKETTATRQVALPKMKVRDSRYRSTSSILHELTWFDGDSISVRDLSAQLGDRGFGLMLLLFALPNTIPLPIPGISTLTGMPLIFFASQLCLGKERIWLPSWLANRQIPMSKLRPLIQKPLPWLVRLEKLIKPRLDKITTRNFERFAGALILLLALLIALPIPLGNLPLGIAMAVLALAITERDGIVMITGWLLTFFALYFFAALITGYAWIIWQLVSSIF